MRKLKPTDHYLLGNPKKMFYLEHLRNKDFSFFLLDRNIYPLINSETDYPYTAIKYIYENQLVRNNYLVWELDSKEDIKKIKLIELV